MAVYSFSEASQRALTTWLLCGNVGASSKALVCAAMGLPGSKYLPEDASDFHRCVQLYEAVPEMWRATSVIITNQPKLAALFKHWPDLAATYRSSFDSPQYERFVNSLMAMFVDGMRADGMVELSPGCWAHPE
ncbi:hypothetical protein VPZ60_004232 [Salmonella enterica]|nr:hypothetical protein [Salmonella enterica]